MPVSAVVRKMYGYGMVCWERDIVMVCSVHCTLDWHLLEIKSQDGMFWGIFDTNQNVCECRKWFELLMCVCPIYFLPLIERCFTLFFFPFFSFVLFFWSFLDLLFAYSSLFFLYILVLLLFFSSDYYYNYHYYYYYSFSSPLYLYRHVKFSTFTTFFLIFFCILFWWHSNEDKVLRARCCNSSCSHHDSYLTSFRVRLDSPEYGWIIIRWIHNLCVPNVCNARRVYRRWIVKFR